MGGGDHNDQVYIINFGLARMYRTPQTHLHILYNKNCHPTRTTAYVLINNHLDVEQSHCDNMESLAYVLLYFFHGSLPWLGVEPLTNQQQHNPILQQKMSLPLNFLGSAHPNKFNLFLDYTCNLYFDEKPNYAYLHKLFCDLLVCK